MTAIPAIVVRNLRRAFGGRVVLQDVNLLLRRGQTAALIGANGSGKTTLLDILATLLLPTSGGASILGHDVAAEAAAVRQAIGYCPSNLQSFYPRLSGRRNLAFFAALYGLGQAAAKARCERLLVECGLADAADERVEKYSDGMRGRLCLARALITDAPVLLLDEPTKSIDREGRALVQALVQRPDREGRPRTILWVTHDRDEAARVADHVVTLDGGVIQRPMRRAHSA